jgi:hypothetical protein
MSDSLGADHRIAEMLAVPAAGEKNKLTKGPSNMTKSRNTLVRGSDLGSVNYLVPSALLDGEDEAAYTALSQDIIACVKPRDIFEEIWANDITNLQWEVMRWRRLQVMVMNMARHHELRHHIIPFADRPRELARAAMAREPEAVREAEAILSISGKSMDDLAAAGFLRQLDRVSQINDFVGMAEGQRNAALAELARHRKSLTMREALAKADAVEVSHKAAGGAEGPASEAQTAGLSVAA